MHRIWAVGHQFCPTVLVALIYQQAPLLPHIASEITQGPGGSIRGSADSWKAILPCPCCTCADIARNPVQGPTGLLLSGWWFACDAFVCRCLPIFMPSAQWACNISVRQCKAPLTCVMQRTPQPLFATSDALTCKCSQHCTLPSPQAATSCLIASSGLGSEALLACRLCKVHVITSPIHRNA